jgi:anti-sigma factor RsiW
MDRNTFCTSMARSILASVEGTIAPDAREALAAHLEICAACRTALAEQRGIKRLLADLPLATVSTDFAARVRQRVAPLSWLDFVNWRAWTLRLAPVAVALMLLLAWLPARSAISTASINAQTDTIAAALDSWAASTVTSATSSSTSSASHLPMLLNPNVDGNALVAAAIGDSTDEDAIEGASR